MMILDFLFGKKKSVIPETSINIEDIEGVEEKEQNISIIDNDIELFNSTEITAIYSRDDVKKIRNNS